MLKADYERLKKHPLGPGASKSTASMSQSHLDVDPSIAQTDLDRNDLRRHAETLLGATRTGSDLVPAGASRASDWVRIRRKTQNLAANRRGGDLRRQVPEGPCCRGAAPSKEAAPVHGAGTFVVMRYPASATRNSLARTGVCRPFADPSSAGVAPRSCYAASIGSR